MNGFEWNKIFAAVLLAGLVTMFGGFVARELVHSEKLEKNAYVVEGVAAENMPTAATGAGNGPTGPAPIAPLLAKADPAAGQKIARQCQACHGFEEGGPNKVGPNLYGIVGNSHAHKEDFSYSAGMAALHGQPWTYDALNDFLYSPKDAVKGTKMTFAGVKNDQDRANLIAWLRTISPSAPPLPAAE